MNIKPFIFVGCGSSSGSGGAQAADKVDGPEGRSDDLAVHRSLATSALIPQQKKTKNSFYHHWLAGPLAEVREGVLGLLAFRLRITPGLPTQFRSENSARLHNNNAAMSDDKK